MKQYMGKIIGLYMVIALAATLFANPAFSQDNQDDPVSWWLYDALKDFKPFLQFQDSLFSNPQLRKKFGSKYLIGYMDGVNSGASVLGNFLSPDSVAHNYWYYEGFRDGFMDGIDMHSINLSRVFGFFAYQLPYRSVLGWLRGIAIPDFYTPDYSTIYSYMIAQIQELPRMRTEDGLMAPQYAENAKIEESKKNEEKNNTKNSTSINRVKIRKPVSAISFAGVNRIEKADNLHLKRRREDPEIVKPATVRSVKSDLLKQYPEFKKLVEKYNLYDNLNFYNVKVDRNGNLQQISRVRSLKKLRTERRYNLQRLQRHNSRMRARINNILRSRRNSLFDISLNRIRNQHSRSTPKSRTIRRKAKTETVQKSKSQSSSVRRSSRSQNRNNESDSQQL